MDRDFLPARYLFEDLWEAELFQTAFNRELVPNMCRAQLEYLQIYE